MAVWMIIGGSVLSAVASFSFLMSGDARDWRRGAGLLALGAALQAMALVVMYLAGVAQ